MQRIVRRVLQVLDGTPVDYGSQRQRGQSTVELALTLPIILILVVGIIEVGWFANNYVSLLESAKVGGRRGPFLNGNESPQNFPLFDATDSDDPPDHSVIHPQSTSRGQTALALPGNGDFDADNIRNRVRGITSPPSELCDGIGSIEDYGFYNLVACETLNSMDPLVIRTGIDDNTIIEEDGDLESDDSTYGDDIVISAFSIQHLNIGPQGVDNPATVGTIDPYDYPIPGYETGHQVVVVGRWPPQANECGNDPDSNTKDHRDPFDYIVNNDHDTIPIVVNGQTIILPIEMGLPIYDTGGQIIDYAGYQDADGAAPETQRGFVWTGQHGINGEDGCTGSEFTVQEIEALMNLPRFLQDAEDLAFEQDRRRYLPTSGLVLVEIFWEHELLLGKAIPLISVAYGFLDQLADDERNQNVIHVWAAFPAPSAQPNIIFTVED